MDKISFIEIMEPWLREHFPSLELQAIKNQPNLIDHILIHNGEQQGSNWYTGLIGCVFTEGGCSVGLWNNKKDRFKYFRPADPEFLDKASEHLNFIFEQCKLYTHS